MPVDSLVLEHAMPDTPVRSADLVRDALDRFLRAVELRALRHAELATGNRDDALEIVQEAMVAFVRSYRHRPEPQWRPLFWGVLGNGIADFHRRRRVRTRWLGTLRQPEDGSDPLATVRDAAEPGPPARLADAQALGVLKAALRALPPRQREAFLLRVWEGLDVAQTAQAMAVSEGSVKTHLFRALQALRARLEEHR